MSNLAEQSSSANGDLGLHRSDGLAVVGEAQAELRRLPVARRPAVESIRINYPLWRRPYGRSELAGMTGSRNERDKARRLYLLCWIPLALMGMLLAACVAVSDFSLRTDGLTLGAALMGPLLTAVGLGLILGEREWGWRFGFAMLAVAQLGFLGSFAGPLSYIAASANLPLQDASFARLDRLLGLDWTAYYSFIMARPELLPYAKLSYAAIMISPFGVSLALGLTGNFARLQHFVNATVLTVALVAAVSAILPAIGTYAELRLPAEVGDFRATGYLVQLEVLPVLRAGGLRVLDLAHLSGIITFPSFHAAAGILAIWAFWVVWWLRPAALIAYVSMLLATPLMDGHYFVDVIAGIGAAALAIGASKRLSPVAAATRTRTSFIGMSV